MQVPSSGYWPVRSFSSLAASLFTVCYGGKRRTCAVDCNRKSGSAGKGSGKQPDGTRRIEMEEVFHRDSGEGGGAYDYSREHYEHLALALERAEEAGAGLYADSEYEQHETEVSEFLGDDDSEVPEGECDENHSRNVKRQALYLDPSEQETQRYYHEQREIGGL